MYAIAGSILLNAACLCMTSDKTTSGIYSMQLALTAVGGVFIGADLSVRLPEFFQKSRSQNESKNE